MLDHWLGTEALRGIRWVLWGLTAFLLWLAWTRPWRKADRALAVFFVLALSIALLAPTNSKGVSTGNRQEKAMAMWKERCQKAGEFIHETVEDVEGVYLMKTRESVNYADQFKLDDPYGHDSADENLVIGFLRKDASPNEASKRATDGYRYVVAREDWGDGQLHRFTGSWVATRKMDVNAPAIQSAI